MKNNLSPTKQKIYEDYINLSDNSLLEKLNSKKYKQEVNDVIELILFERNLLTSDYFDKKENIIIENQNELKLKYITENRENRKKDITKHIEKYNTFPTENLKDIVKNNADYQIVTIEAILFILVQRNIISSEDSQKIVSKLEEDDFSKSLKVNKKPEVFPNYFFGVILVIVGFILFIVSETMLGTIKYSFLIISSFGFKLIYSQFKKTSLK